MWPPLSPHSILGGRALCPLERCRNRSPGYHGLFELEGPLETIYYINLQMRTLRPREGNKLAQCHTASEGQSQVP